jgi:hypothetical protein
MREKKDTFFLRQHIKMTSKPRPSNRDDVIRLKFLEVPYRLWYKIPKGYRTAIFSIAWACIIPYTMYSLIIGYIRWEAKAKLRASLGNDESKILEMMEKVKVK